MTLVFWAKLSEVTWPYAVMVNARRGSYDNMQCVMHTRQYSEQSAVHKTQVCYAAVVMQYCDEATV